MRGFLILSLFALMAAEVGAWSDLDVIEAPRNCNSESLKLLLKDVNIQVNKPVRYTSSQASTPLMIAVEHGCSRNVELLLDAGADPTVRPAGNTKTAVEIARARGDTGIVAMLIGAIECARMEEKTKSLEMNPTRNFRKVCRDSALEVAKLTNKEMIDSTCKRYCENIANELNLKADERADVTLPCIEGCRRNTRARLK